MYSNVDSKKSISFVATLLALSVIGFGGDVFAQAPATTTSSTSTTVQTAAPAATTTSSTATKTKTSSRPRLRKMRAHRASTRKHTTARTSSGGLSGGVSRTHHHHHHYAGGTHKPLNPSQQKRLNKLNAFLKNPPKMKKAPEFGHPGLTTPMTSP